MGLTMDAQHSLEVVTGGTTFEIDIGGKAFAGIDNVCTSIAAKNTGGTTIAGIVSGGTTFAGIVSGGKALSEFATEGKTFAGIVSGCTTFSGIVFGGTTFSGTVSGEPSKHPVYPIISLPGTSHHDTNRGVPKRAQPRRYPNKVRIDIVVFVDGVCGRIDVLHLSGKLLLHCVTVPAVISTRQDNLEIDLAVVAA